jgi:hypothetical protein
MATWRPVPGVASRNEKQSLGSRLRRQVKTARGARSYIRALLGGARLSGAVVAALLATGLAACGGSAQGKSDTTAPGQVAATAAGQAGTTGSRQAPIRAAIASLAGAATSGASPCGSAAPEILAKTAGLAAMQIYAREVSSAAVRADQNQVESYESLLSALASGNRAGVRQAVNSLVYSHTHIVRLRVTQGHAVLADVGGPYILAPVGGNLRFHGRSVGHYVLSVQDDVGYVKLETRYIGVPLVLHAGSQRLPLEGTLAPGPATIPDLGPVTYGGVSYESFSFPAKAFPQGQLRISLLVPGSHSPSGKSCDAIKVAELGYIAQRIWHRFSVASAPPSAYVHSIGSLIGGLSYVRSGTHQLAGSTQPGPSRLPEEGAVKYRGVTYRVSSFAATTASGPARVYLLVA